MSFSVELPTELQLLTISQFRSVTLTHFSCDPISQFLASHLLLKPRMLLKGNWHSSVHIRGSMATLALKAPGRVR